MPVFRVIQSSERSAISMRLCSAYSPCARSPRPRDGSSWVANRSSQCSERGLFANSRNAPRHITQSDKIRVHGCEYRKKEAVTGAIVSCVLLRYQHILGRY